MSNASWMVASDVATTCTSRIAMNMPMHIMAKPIQTVAVTACVALFSFAEIIAGPVEDSGGRALDTSPSTSAQAGRGGHAEGNGSIALSDFGSKRQRPSGFSAKFSRFDAMSAVAGDGERLVPHICHAKAG